MIFILCAIFIIVNISPVKAHGRLIEPPSRASAWRYGFKTPHNYNDHELFCGGYSKQWLTNGGKCGVCGDAWDAKLPRAHEYGGTYGQGVIVRQYNVGAVINLRVELTASHFGYFTFSICPDYKNASQECLDKNILKTVRPQDALVYSDIRYYPKEGSKVYEMKYRLPNLSCSHCLLQWRYIAGNNWGTCPNGTEQVGCGPQEEFRACADVTIGKGFTEASSPVPIDVPTATIAPPEESYSPISAIIISIVSFLVAFLIFFLLYFHYYRVGNKVKNWIKGKSESKTVAGSGNDNDESTRIPMPPPRIKRTRSKGDEHNKLHEISLEY